MELAILIIVIMVFAIGRTSRLKRFKIQRAIFMPSASEVQKNYIFTDRMPESWGRINIMALSDEDFFRKVMIYHNGLLCTNSLFSVQDNVDCKCDVARHIDRPWELLFSPENSLEEDDVIQIIIFR